jgi:starch synthase
VDHGEFYNRFSMLKAGLTFSDAINTVSERYAEEICTPEYGYGFASVLQGEKAKLSGIVNGIDTQTWDPATDPFLAAHYGPGGKIRMAKARNRRVLLEALGAGAAALDSDAMLFGFVGRLAHQKGVDLIAGVMPGLLRKHPVRFVLIGSGDAELERTLRRLAHDHPDRVFVLIGYSEEKAHLLEAGCDSFVMPSRYEPCGLNQMYSLRYGTPPVVRNTGGLADTVVDANARNIELGSATGFLFEKADTASLHAALERAIAMHARPRRWMQLIRQGMQQELGWEQSARRYLSLYRQKREVADNG